MERERSGVSSAQVSVSWIKPYPQDVTHPPPPLDLSDFLASGLQTGAEMPKGGSNSGETKGSR